MSFVDWSPSYTVHNATLDGQHQKLIELINNVHAAAFAKKGREIISPTLHQLIEYTKSHFPDEEREMEANGCPRLAEHRAAHQQLITKLTDLESRYNSGKESMVADMFGFLVGDWLVTHILTMDKECSSYMRSQPEKNATFTRSM